MDLSEIKFPVLYLIESSNGGGVGVYATSSDMVTWAKEKHRNHGSASASGENCFSNYTMIDQSGRAFQISKLVFENRAWWLRFLGKRVDVSLGQASRAWSFWEVKQRAIRWGRTLQSQTEGEKRQYFVAITEKISNTEDWAQLIATMNE